MNAVAIQKEIERRQSELANATDKYDVLFLEKCIKSLKTELSGMKKQDYNTIFANCD